jgi:hypothetical protein
LALAELNLEISPPIPLKKIGVTLKLDGDE